LSVDYLATLGLFDVPLPFGLNFQKAALGFHAEGLGQWDPYAGRISLDPSLYLAAELMAYVGYSNLGLPPIGAGIAVRINPLSPASFDVTRDLGFYVYASFDSFRDAAARERSFPFQGTPCYTPPNAR
jgi:hypothetical protein